jgi:hypothetical protein
LWLQENWISTGEIPRLIYFLLMVQPHTVNWRVVGIAGLACWVGCLCNHLGQPRANTEQVLLMTDSSREYKGLVISIVDPAWKQGSLEFTAVFGFIGPRQWSVKSFELVQCLFWQKEGESITDDRYILLLFGESFSVGHTNYFEQRCQVSAPVGCDYMALRFGGLTTGVVKLPSRECSMRPTRESNNARTAHPLGPKCDVLTKSSDRIEPIAALGFTTRMALNPARSRMHGRW